MPESTSEAPKCHKCGKRPPGPGGILCPDCRTAIEAQRLP